MTDKEFKRLTRAQLIDVIYQLQLQIDKLSEQNSELESELADKRIRLSNAGNIAEASLEINRCFQTAQNAADQYLAEIRILRDEAKAEKQRILDGAREEAIAIIARAKEVDVNYDLEIENILRSYGHGDHENGEKI